jgi:hypothetical protein
MVKEKGGKPDRKLNPLPDRLRNPYGNLKCENSQDHAQKPQQNCTFMNSASVVEPSILYRLLSYLLLLFHSLSPCRNKTTVWLFILIFVLSLKIVNIITLLSSKRRNIFQEINKYACLSDFLSILLWLHTVKSGDISSTEYIYW